jgi:hypothetical protein
MPVGPLLILAAAATAPVPAAKPADAPGQTIVVTGTRLSDTEKALRDCIARHCPPDQDIRASLAHAENLFVAGRYRDARDVTKASIGRNNRYRKDYPVPVSDLYRGNARIAEHLGEAADFQLSTAMMRGILGNAFGKEDARTIKADIEVGDMFAKLGQFVQARATYDTTEKRARAAGLTPVADIARVRSAWTYAMDGEIPTARKSLETIAADAAPTARTGRLAALVLLARLDRNEGKTGKASQALFAELRSLHAKRPVLLFSPRLDLPSIDPEGDNAEAVKDVTIATPDTRMLTGNGYFEKHWVDVGFWVTPEGKVTDPEILRGEGSRDWTKPLLRSISGRLYTPSTDPDGTYRVERYTLTSRWRTDLTGSHMRRRSPNVRIEFLDLTNDPAPPPPAGAPEGTPAA